MRIRVGQGFDVHKWAKGRPLFLGGIEIPYDKGLAGHSDADVLVHAICDALLGALALGDIGVHFPDTDPSFSGISSMKLLEMVARMVREAGWKVNNVDATVMAQRPKLVPHIPKMRALLAPALGVREEEISIKATTTEGLGFVGREEGIAAIAVALISREEE